VSSTPPLSSKNHFAVLSIEEIYKPHPISSNDYSTDGSQVVLTPPPPSLQFRKCPQWERQLPDQYIIASTTSLNLFELDVSIQTLDMDAVHTMQALLNSGVTGLFINSDFVT
jgi:hypothetical protein